MIHIYLFYPAYGYYCICIAQVYVDGFIRLGAPGESVCTESFPTSSGPIIASFWTDADTRNGVGYLSARVTTDVSILSRARTDISLSSGRLLFDPVWALVATWNVSPAQSDADKVSRPKAY